MPFPFDLLLPGPQPLDRAYRLAKIDELVANIIAKHGQQVLLIGLYGSMARGSDSAYSDIEMLCVLDTHGDDYSYEWVYGPGKAEINFQSRAIALAHAAEFDDTWPLTHGSYLDLKQLHGDSQILDALKAAVKAHADVEFQNLIALIIVGDLYEYIAKLRGACVSGNTRVIPMLAYKSVQQCALMIGLANRHLYTTNTTVLTESLTLPNRPSGYDAICRRVLSGEMSNTTKVADQLEALWADIIRWAETNNIPLAEQCRDPF